LGGSLPGGARIGFLVRLMAEIIRFAQDDSARDLDLIELRRKAPIERGCSHLEASAGKTTAKIFHMML
jgi:hypothetical protein